METDDHDRRWAHKSQAAAALQKLANAAERERAVVRRTVKALYGRLDGAEKAKDAEQIAEIDAELLPLERRHDLLFGVSNFYWQQRGKGTSHTDFTFATWEPSDPLPEPPEDDGPTDAEIRKARTRNRYLL